MSKPPTHRRRGGVAGSSGSKGSRKLEVYSATVIVRGELVKTDEMDASGGVSHYRAVRYCICGTAQQTAEKGGVLCREDEREISAPDVACIPTRVASLTADKGLALGHVGRARPRSIAATDPPYRVLYPVFTPASVILTHETADALSAFCFSNDLSHLPLRCRPPRAPSGPVCVIPALLSSAPELRPSKLDTRHRPPACAHPPVSHLKGPTPTAQRVSPSATSPSPEGRYAMPSSASRAAFWEPVSLDGL
ncbi:hypothetical protein NUW54_g8939 [Trametes sanguinea]|uniref:Uncharacterized protein n=1 Tax=Trametes sanguinea TaxID=158606 RepID=A0ACC1PA88_9APHY|nr:hypothetical protein NUW54_g8939 [Trametes sanguinea]